MIKLCPRFSMDSSSFRHKSRFSRRSALRGILGGSAITVGLPWLESIAPRGLKGQALSEARAQLSNSPKRFAMFFWGNGCQPDRWLPNGDGEAWMPSPLLEPLAHLRNEIAVISGMEVKVGNIEAHISGPAGFFTGKQAIVKGGGGWTFQGPTIDQQIAALIGGETLYRSLEVGAEPNMRGMSMNGPDSHNTPESDPIALYERLFGATFREPGEGMVDPKLALRQSALDAVMEDMHSLKSRLGNHDKARLDQHLTAVRDLELRLARLQETPILREACVKPERPSEVSLVEGRVQLEARAQVMADLSAIALACDLTRVLSFWYCDPLSNLLHPNTNSGHHQLTHDEPGDQPQVTEIIMSAQRSLAYFIERLRSIPEGEGTLLDQCALLATTDVSEGKTHQIDEYPILLAGQAGGALKMGHHYRSTTKENTSHLALSVVRALGIPAASYGEDEAFVESGLSAVEA